MKQMTGSVLQGLQGFSSQAMKTGVQQPHQQTAVDQQTGTQGFNGMAQDVRQAAVDQQPENKAYTQRIWSSLSNLLVQKHLAKLGG